MIVEYQGMKLHLSTQGASGYKGVTYRGSSGKWRAQATKGVGNAGVGPLGDFDTKLEAAVCCALAMPEPQPLLHAPHARKAERVRAVSPQSGHQEELVWARREPP